MRNIISSDRFNGTTGFIFEVRRPDPFRAVAEGELPQENESVVMDGKIMVVKKAVVAGDSEFNFWPVYLVLESTEP